MHIKVRKTRIKYRVLPVFIFAYHCFSIEYFALFNSKKSTTNSTIIQIYVFYSVKKRYYICRKFLGVFAAYTDIINGSKIMQMKYYT